MITDFFLKFVYWFLSGLISIFPTGSGFPADVHTAGLYFGGTLDLWSPIIPWTSFLSALSLLISFELAIFAFRTLKWIISHIPWFGGKGK